MDLRSAGAGVRLKRKLLIRSAAGRQREVSLIRRKQPQAEPVTLITLREAAEMLRLDESTIRKGRAGTDVLTLVRQGRGKRQPIFLIREEVEGHIASMVEHARSQKRRIKELVFGT
jgi:hypothetical protein